MEKLRSCNLNIHQTILEHILLMLSGLFCIIDGLILICSFGNVLGGLGLWSAKIIARYRYKCKSKLN